MTGSPDIPQELIDEIMDHCSGVKRTLIACSLTSRTWVHRTRKHLFSKLTLTDKTLPIWCGIVVTPTPTTGRSPLPDSHPPSGSSSYPSHRLSSCVTSLHLAPEYTPALQVNLSIDELLPAKSHLSAFTHLKCLALTAVSFLDFDDASLDACFGSLAETVQELKLCACLMDRKVLLPFMRLFTHLQSLEVSGDTWFPSVPDGNTETPKDDLPTFRGSFTASGFSDRNYGLLESLAIARTEYHAITLGLNLPLVLPQFDVLLRRCKDHLKILSLTAPEAKWRQYISEPSFYPRLPHPDRTTLTKLQTGDWLDPAPSLDLSPCERLVEIQARFAHCEFDSIIPTLKTVVSPRFRKLTFFIIPPLPAVKTDAWAKLDEEVTALAKRVNATAVDDRLQVLFSSYSKILGGIKLSEVEMALPRIASNACVSLRAENPR